MAVSAERDQVIFYVIISISVYMMNLNAMSVTDATLVPCFYENCIYQCLRRRSSASGPAGWNTRSPRAYLWRASDC